MLFSSSEIPAETRDAVNSLSKRGRLPQSVLLTGGSPALRAKCSLELALAVNCSHPKDGQPCMKCPNCIKIKAGTHPDLTKIVPPKDRKNVLIKSVKEQVIEDLYIAPNEGQNKIYIFPDAHELSEVIQNALLKTLEEPPEFDMFIFESETREAMLTTVISRCTEFHLGDTVSSKSKKENEKVTAIACSLIDNMCRGTSFDIMMATSPMYKNRALMKKVAVKIITVIRDALAENSGAALLSGCETQAIQLGIKYSPKQLTEIKQSLDLIIIAADSNANENLMITKFASILSQGV